MDILLSHGYFIAEDVHEQQIMKPYPPLGLLYISAYLKSRGYAVELFDSTFADLAAFADTVRRTRPGVVGLYVNLMTKQSALRMMAICQQAGSSVVLGGPEPVNDAERYLRAGARAVVRGEGEHTLEALIPALARGRAADLADIPGITYLDDGGQLVETPAREQIRPLSALPWPDREAIDIDRYLETWRSHHGYGSISLITARGCPYTCKWCSHSVFGHTHRRRDVDDVADEVVWLHERYRPDSLWYADDVFTINPRWFLAYHEALKRRGLRLPFECISRADRLNERVVDALADMGCQRLWIGSESGSQRILDAMSRQADAADVRAKTRLLQSRGIEVGMFIMLGYEGETVADIEETVDHLKAAGPDVFLTTVAYPIRGTAFYHEVAERITSDLPWEARTDRDLRIAGRHSAAFYAHATRWMVSAVGLHQARRAGAAPWQLARLAINAGRGRLGMWRTRHQREGANGTAGGRGWTPAERADMGW